jgi:hypothetical protein
MQEVSQSEGRQVEKVDVTIVSLQALKQKALLSILYEKCTITQEQPFELREGCFRGSSPAGYVRGAEAWIAEGLHLKKTHRGKLPRGYRQRGRTTLNETGIQIDIE